MFLTVVLLTEEPPVALFLVGATVVGFLVGTGEEDLTAGAFLAGVAVAVAFLTAGAGVAFLAGAVARGFFVGSLNACG